MFLLLFQVLTDLSMSNCTMGDFAAANLACALENNKTLEKLSIESNNVSPQTLVKIFEVSGEIDSGSTVRGKIKCCGCGLIGDVRDEL